MVGRVRAWSGASGDPDRVALVAATNRKAPEPCCSWALFFFRLPRERQRHFALEIDGVAAPLKDLHSGAQSEDAPAPGVELDDSARLPAAKSLAAQKCELGTHARLCVVRAHL